MLTNTDRLDAIETGLNAASLKMNKTIEFYETKDAIESITVDIENMFNSLDYIDRILDTCTEVLSITEER
jgi:hypothetical protein